MLPLGELVCNIMDVDYMKDEKINVLKQMRLLSLAETAFPHISLLFCMSPEASALSPRCSYADI
mgnify:CR=1 FL=1